MGNVLEEFNDEQLLFMLGTKRALKDTAQGQTNEAEKGEDPKTRLRAGSLDPGS